MKIKGAKFQVKIWLLKRYPKIFHKLQILLINLPNSIRSRGPQKNFWKEKFESSQEKSFIQPKKIQTVQNSNTRTDITDTDYNRETLK